MNDPIQPPQKFRGEILPQRTVHLTKMSCATDATRYVHLNLPTVIFGATGFGTHAKQERVSLQSLVEYAEMFTAYLANLKY